jgi:hypothetical protein
MKKVVLRYSRLCGAIAGSALIAIPMRAITIDYTRARTTFTPLAADVYAVRER